MRLDVGIVGAGTAGAAAALFLRRQGHAVTIYEAVPEPTAVGAGIMIQPSGLAVLARLGIDAPILARGAEVARLRCLTRSGKSVVDLAYADLDPTWHGIGLHRGVLFQELHRAVAREKIPLLTGVVVEHVQRKSGAIRLVDHEGRVHGPHELLVVADGARSRLRAATSLVREVRPYTWGALWYVGHDVDESFEGELHQVVDGAQRMIGLLPTGLGPEATGGALASTGRDPRLVSLFFSVRVDRVPAVRAAGLAAFRDEVLGTAPRAEAIVDQITSVDELTFASYHDVVMDRWATRDVVVLGDAAHAMSPQLGQGCNLALCDAATLADALEGATHLPSALDRYSRDRRDHLAFYQFATRWLTPFFQSDLEPLGLFRDLFMGPASRIPFVRREMVRSMTGTKTGIFLGQLDVRAAPFVRKNPSLRPGAALSSGQRIS